MRWTEANLKEQLDAALKTASALLAENFLAQDRRRLIRCMELLDEAQRAIDGGAWVAHVPDATKPPATTAAEPEAVRSAGLIMRETEPARKAG